MKHVLRGVWHLVTRFATAIVPILLVSLRYFLLLGVLIVGIALWATQWFANLLRRNPQSLMGGMNPMGAAPVIRWGSGKSIWIVAQARRWLGRYVEKYHPILFPHLQGLFK